MKSCAEITENLLKRRDEYFAEKKTKMKKTVGIAAFACCLCVVVLVSVFVGMDGNPAVKLPVASNVQATNADKSQADSQNTAEVSTTKGKGSVASNGGFASGKYTPNKAEKTTDTVTAWEDETVEGVVNGTGAGTTKTPKKDGTFDKDFTENQSTTNDTPKWIEKIEITRMPDKTVYYLGDTFDFTGLVVTGYFANGAVEDVTAGVTFSNHIAGAVSNKYEVTIQYYDKTDEINGCWIELPLKVLEPNIDISAKSMVLNVGDTQKNNAVTEATECTITWYSTDTSVATVDSDGNVTAVGEGTASVYAVISYNNFSKQSDYCTITVISAETEV